MLIAAPGQPLKNIGRLPRKLKKLIYGTRSSRRKKGLYLYDGEMNPSWEVINDLKMLGVYINTTQYKKWKQS